jgi:hypothetical protein
MKKSAPGYCASCLAETGECNPIVRWNCTSICREHLAQTHMRYEGIAPYPVDVMVDAPAMLQ